MDQRETSQRGSSELPKLLLVVLAVGVFWIPYVRHYSATGVPPGFLPTGFVQHDQAAYPANGREIFERGNGFAYPNPFDPAADAPVIYFHWFIWILGFGIKKLGIDPGLLYAALGIIGSILAGWFTFRLVEAVLPDRRHATLLFFFAMWGGGVLCVTRAAVNLFQHRPVVDDILAYDLSRGWWFLYWGRNVVYSTEAVYHALAAATWLAVLRERWRLALLGTALLASTHPFSGLELLLMIVTWLSLAALVRRSRQMIYYWLASIVLLGLFASYYFLYLESFEQYRAMRRAFAELLFIHPSLTALLAYGPVGLVAICRLWIDRRRLEPHVFFFCTCFLVAFLLTKHDWFIAQHQPAHFARGYVWMPLCLIALPLLQRLLVRGRSLLPAATFGLLLVLPVGAVAVSDNVLFLVTAWRDGGGPLYLTVADREMLTWMEHENLTGELLCSNPTVSYLSATYTSVRPFFGHPYNTPDYGLRRELADYYLQTCQAGPWLAQIDYVLLHKQVPSNCLDPTHWQRLHENDSLILFGKRIPPETE